MDLRQLGYVVAIADEGSFTRAARTVHVAQPSLSQAVRTLEAELGVEVFHRTPRGAVLTAAGAALLGPARQAIRDAGNARAAVAAVAGLRSGHLDLVSLPTLAVHPTAALIGRLRQAHPGITVRLLDPEDADAAAEQVRDGAAEIGLTELPVTVHGLAAHPLEEQEYVALVPERHDTARRPRRRIGIRALARQPLITSRAGTSTRRQIDDAFAAAGLRATVAVETDHREAIGPLVTAGAGVAVLPRNVAEDSRTAGVAVVPIAPRITRSVGIIHRDGPLSPAARAFLALVLDAGVAAERPPPRQRS